MRNNKEARMSNLLQGVAWRWQSSMKYLNYSNEDGSAAFLLVLSL